MSRRAGRGGRPRHLDHRGGPRPHDPTRNGRPLTPAASGPTPSDGAHHDLDGAGFEPPSGSDEVAREAVVAFSEVATGDAGLPVDPPGPSPDGQASEQAAPSPTSGPARLPASVPASETSGPSLAGPVLPNGDQHPAQAERQAGCTTAQLRRFIKSRAYVPLHEIRRRFLIATEDDDVSGIDLETGRVFVGLPPREGQMLGELLRGGEVGYELQLDPVAPVVVGVYPMRPVSRS